MPIRPERPAEAVEGENIMAHEIEQFTDGSAAFVGAREHAWHRLGTVLPQQFTAAECMDHAFLGGWDVRKEPLTTTVVTAEGVALLDVPDAYATVRTHPKTGLPDVLGVVGNGYRPIQNEAHADLLNTLVDQSGAHFETAGSLRGGKQVFITMKAPTTMLIGGRDAVDLYLVALNSHDGSSAFRLLVSPVRVVCANTQAAAIAGAKSSYKIRHTSGAAGYVAEARQALGLTFKYAEAFQAKADAMISEQITRQEFDALIGAVWASDAADTGSKRAKTIKANRDGELRRLMWRADTNEAIRGTRWAAYQSVTEYLDHTAPVSAKSGQADARAERAICSTTVEAVKVRAFDLLKI